MSLKEGELNRENDNLIKQKNENTILDLEVKVLIEEEEGKNVKNTGRRNCAHEGQISKTWPNRQAKNQYDQ